MNEAHLPLQLEFQDECASSIDVCTAYWACNRSGEYAKSVRAVSAEHSIAAHRLTKLVQSCCIATDPNLLCAECNEALSFRNRTERAHQVRLKARSGDASVLCGACRSRAADLLLKEIDRARREEEVRRQANVARVRAAIASQFKLESCDFDIASLSLQQAIYLHVLLNKGGSEDYSTIVPLRQLAEVAPTKELALEMVETLIGGRLVAVDEMSNEEAFLEREDGSLIPNYELVRLRVNLAGGKDKAQLLIDKIRNSLTSADWPGHWRDEAELLAKKVAMHEALCLLRIAMEERSLNPQTGKMTRSNLGLILESCSVGQASYIVLRCAKNAVDYIAKKQVPRHRAENSVAGNLLSTYQYWIDRQWQIPSHNRYGKSRESELSRVVFRVLLRAGPDWFHVPISQMVREVALSHLAD